MVFTTLFACLWMELTQSSTMSDIYDEATANSTFLSDRNSRLWDLLSIDGDESSIDHLLTTYGIVPQAVDGGTSVHRSNGG